MLTPLCLKYLHTEVYIYVLELISRTKSYKSIALKCLVAFHWDSTILKEKYEVLLVPNTASFRDNLWRNGSTALCGMQSQPLGHRAVRSRRADKMNDNFSCRESNVCRPISSPVTSLRHNIKIKKYRKSYVSCAFVTTNCKTSSTGLAMSVSFPVPPHVTTLEPMNGFSLNLILRTFTKLVVFEFLTAVDVKSFIFWDI